MSAEDKSIAAKPSELEKFALHAVAQLRDKDPELHAMLTAEYERQHHSLAMVASCSPAHPSVLFCEGSFASNVTAEGYPGRRYHAGCTYVDKFEQLAIDRAKKAFSAEYANVQPHSASTANQIVMASLLDPGDTLLGLDLDCGGHLSHGSSVNISGTIYDAVSYGLDENGYIDYDAVAALAKEKSPKLIICGTTAYPREIDWRRFRQIADDVGAYLLADITHTAGLIIAGQHENPVDVAHVTVTCTHKQLYGPRGGLILLGRDKDALCPDGKTKLHERMQRGVFPLMQGAPIINSIVAKARALDRATTPEFRELAERIVSLAKGFASSMAGRGARVISGGTDNHIVVVDVLESFGVTGIVAERALQDCDIIVNKNRIPGDTKAPMVGSGVRIGTNSLAARGFDETGIEACADLFGRVLRSVKVEGDRKYTLEERARDGFRAEVEALCRKYPIASYPAPESLG